MSTIAKESAKQSLVIRARGLSAETPAVWGTMSATEMVVHVNRALKMALGRLPVKDVSNVISKTLMKHLVLLGMPIPKGKIQTLPELDMRNQDSPDPSTLAHHVDEMEQLIDQIVLADHHSLADHGAFGPMNQRQWCRLVYLHIDHHLKQFGV